MSLSSKLQIHYLNQATALEEEKNQNFGEQGIISENKIKKVSFSNIIYTNNWKCLTKK